MDALGKEHDSKSRLVTCCLPDSLGKRLTDKNANADFKLFIFNEARKKMSSQPGQDFD